MVWKFEQDGREGQLFWWRDLLSCLQSQLLERRLIRASYISATPIISYFVFQNQTTSMNPSVKIRKEKKMDNINVYNCSFHCIYTASIKGMPNDASNRV